jgi:hypothetical protein
MLPKIFGLACSNWCQVLKDASASSRGEAVLKFIKIVWSAISKPTNLRPGPFKASLPPGPALRWAVLLDG